MISKQALIVDLTERIEANCRTITEAFQPLDNTQLTMPPSPKEWHILQCFEHLNLTHEYYMSRIERVTGGKMPASPTPDNYAPSFWGRIYMAFALNPKFSFPAPDEIAPSNISDRAVLGQFLAKQEALLVVLGQLDKVDLRQVHVPIEKWVKFNLGDCLKILVYHDQLHIGQAERILAEIS